MNAQHFCIQEKVEMPIGLPHKNNVTASVAFSGIKMCVIWKRILDPALEGFKNGITMLIKASVKNSLLVDAKATAIALATKKNANQFAYFSKNPRSQEVILT